MRTRGQYYCTLKEAVAKHFSSSHGNASAAEATAGETEPRGQPAWHSVRGATARTELPVAAGKPRHSWRKHISNRSTAAVARTARSSTHWSSHVTGAVCLDCISMESRHSDRPDQSRLPSWPPPITVTTPQAPASKCRVRTARAKYVSTFRHHTRWS